MSPDPKPKADRKKKSAPPAASEAPADPPPAARSAAPDRRPLIYAVLDVVFCVIYGVVAVRIARSSDGAFETGTVLMAIAIGAAAVGTFLRHPHAWWVAVAGCTLVLLGATTILVLLVGSAAFLNSVYGAMGKMASSVSLAIAAIVVEIYVLLPAFQLRYLLSEAGRRNARRLA